MYRILRVNIVLNFKQIALRDNVVLLITIMNKLPHIRHAVVEINANDI